MSRTADEDVFADYLAKDERDFPVEALPEKERALVSALKDELSVIRDLPVSPNLPLAKARLMAALVDPPYTGIRPAGVAPPMATRDTHPARYAVRSPLRAISRTVKYSLAGAMLGVLLLAMGWYDGVQQNRSHSSGQDFTYTTAPGQRATITLPDGSVALLNVGSRLDVPADYATGNRTIRLTGEALFNVVHRGTAPFTVMAGPSTTRVLGTRFVVRHYASDTTATIVVRDGKVAVGDVVLAANQQLVISESTVGAVQPADHARFGFAKGVLILNAIPLQDAIAELSRWYDADIRLGDSALATRQLTGECTAGSLSDLADILQLTFNIRVVKEGRTLTLYSRGSSR